jgi:hypothetical protein
MITIFNYGCYFEMRGNNFNLFCFSLSELIFQAKSIYNIDLLEILN